MAAKPTPPPPAYFLSLSLENVRSFGEKQTISFAREDGRPAQWTIILGDNGVGKTTVLKALAGLETAYIKQHNSQKRDYSPVLSSLFSKRWFPFRSNTKKMTVRYRYSEGAAIGQFNKEIKEDWASVTVSIGENNALEAIHSEYSTYEANEFICYGYGASRTTGNSTLSESPETIDTCASLFDDRADLLNPEEWFLNIDYGIRLLADDKRKQLSDANDRVRQMIKDVLPGVTDLRIDNSGTPQKPQISLQFLLYDTWVRLHDMSLGYQTMVVWLTDFASKLYVRYPDSDNPLAEPAIVLIDEIDLHLHPQWQRELLNVLSDIFPQTQFIATAHSPLVVQAAGDAGANVVLLKREDDQTKVYQGHDLPDVRNWRVEQILNSELFDTPALSAQTEADLTRRNKLLLKKRLTKAEKSELAQLEADVEAQPAGHTRAEQRADSLLARLSRNLSLDDNL